MNYQNAVRYTTATIANGEALSDAIAVGRGAVVLGVVMPASWTTANLTFQATVDGTNFFNLYDNATEYTVTAAASRVIMINSDITDSLQQIKVRSGTSGTPVNQGAERLLTLIVRDVA